jgi:hypothetical protein
LSYAVAHVLSVYLLSYAKKVLANSRKIVQLKPGDEKCLARYLLKLLVRKREKIYEFYSKDIYRYKVKV